MPESLTPAQVAAYLARIGAPAPSGPDRDGLTALVMHHLQTVPFENLDIHRGIPISLDPEHLFAKVVERRRGGYCYELNSTFARLLTALGFSVELLSAQVHTGADEWTPDFDHLCLLVDSPLLGERHLVDVGWGQDPQAPIPLRDGAGHEEVSRHVGLRWREPHWELVADSGEGAVPQYRFTETAHQLGDFAERNRWQQTDPASHFRTQSVVSLTAAAGRVTLSGDKLIETVGGQRSERVVPDDELADVLADRFGLRLD